MPSYGYHGDWSTGNGIQSFDLIIFKHVLFVAEIEFAG